MYDAIKSNAISEEEARNIAGNQVVDELFTINCWFSNRLIDSCFDVVEMDASIEFVDSDDETRTLNIHYLVPQYDIDTFEDMGDYDYSNYTFTII